MRYELIHDTIARQVYEKASTDDQTRRKTEKRIRDRYSEYPDRGGLLTKDDMKYLPPEVKKFVDALPPEKRPKTMNELKLLLRVQLIQSEATVAALKDVEADISAYYTARFDELMRKKAKVAALKDAEADAMASYTARFDELMRKHST